MGTLYNQAPAEHLNVMSLRDTRWKSESELEYGTDFLLSTDVIMKT
jgi:hypothetical protein